MNLDTFENLAEEFFVQLQSQMRSNQITLKPHWQIDHLCYRVECQERYLELKQQILQFSKLLIETEINGRLISTFKLSRPVSFSGYRIDLLELPAPKPGKSLREGFEHIEVVCDSSFDELATQYSIHILKPSEKVFNNEVELSLGDLAVKFHHLSLESVIRLEKNTKVFSALKKSRILEDFRPNSPFVAGTFPLGLDVDGSDLDVLLCSDDLDELEGELFNCYSTWENFEIHRRQNKDCKYLLAKFTVDQVPFEIYAESTFTLRQTAFLHFQVEERLLKFGGDRFREKILNLRESGVKTEPAFANVLGLAGDPYLALLELHSWPEEKLASLCQSGQG